MEKDKDKSQGKDKIRQCLFSPKASNPEFNGAILEQYKIYLEMLDKISERRQHANSFFLSVNTGLCALVGYLFSKDISPELRPLFLCVPVAGMLLSFFWYRLVRSYKDLNTGKFMILHLLEEKLPVAPYSAEWLALEEGKNNQKYTPFTHLEIWVPKCFIGMYWVMLICFIPWKKLIAFFCG